jgi:GTP-binding protein
VATVAIVGRPNVGKSTLFNRLTRSRKALTHDLPGMTRDRVAGDARRPGGGTVVVVDTGGFEPESGDAIPVQIRSQALRAIEDADAVVLVVDGAQGIVPADERSPPCCAAPAAVVLAVNKEDRRDAADAEADFARLGFPAVALSAEHGRGISSLWEVLEPYLPPPEEAEPAEVELAVAIVGRPNVGKSSLLNRLLGEERVLVSEVPGTTRDAVDTLLDWRGRHVRLVDTAGSRRRGRTERGPEVLSVVMARKAIERAQVCLLVLDGSAGVTARTPTSPVSSLMPPARVIVVAKDDLLPAGPRRAARSPSGCASG